MGELWQRLKQRKLVQWAIAWVAFAFALLQGIDIVAQRFNWPPTIERYLILAMIVGFFVVLVLAWYHGEKGAQRVGGMEIMILAVLLAIGGGLMWRFGRSASSPVAVAGVTRSLFAGAGRARDLQRAPRIPPRPRLHPGYAMLQVRLPRRPPASPKNPSRCCRSKTTAAARTSSIFQMASRET